MFVWKPENASPLEQKVANQSYRLGTSDFFTQSVAHTFERTTIGLLTEDTGIRNAEREAGSDDDLGWMIGGLTGTPAVNRNAMSEEEFKAQGFDRNGAIAYTPRTTLQRAKIEAEHYDRRQREAGLLDQSNDTLLRSAIGFGAGFLANLPDPINLIPVGGALSRGASLGRRAVKAATEGIVGTAVADAVLLPEARRRGDDIGFADFALDLTFGALIGGGIGGIGGVMHNRRLAGLHKERHALANVLAEIGYSEGDANKLASSVMSVLADMPDRNALSLAVRQNLAGMDRTNAGKLMDRVMIAMRDGYDIDVARWARELGADNLFTKAEQVIKEQRELIAGYDSVLEHPLGGAPDEVLAAIKPEDIESVLVHRGPAVMKDGEIRVQGNALKNAGLAKRGFGLVKIIFAHGEGGNKTPSMPPITKKDVIDLPLILREYLPAEQEKGVTVWRVPKQDGMSLNIVVGKGQDGPDSRLVTMFMDAQGRVLSQKKVRSESLSLPVERGEDTRQEISGFTPAGQNELSEIKIDLTPHDVNGFAESLNRVSSPTEDANGGGTDSTISQSAKSSKGLGEPVGLQQSHVVPSGIDGEPANSLVIPDFSAPEPDLIITPPSLEESARMESKAVIEEVGSPLDLNATRLVAEGKAGPEDLAFLAEAQAEIKRVDDVENAGLTVLDCVLNALTGGK